MTHRAPNVRPHARCHFRPGPGPGPRIRRLVAAGLLGAASLAANAAHPGPGPDESPDAAPPGTSETAGSRTTRPVPPAGPAGFDGPADPAEIGQVARLALVADTDRIRPGGTFHLAITASMARHWHTYWINPGDTGVPMRITVQAPEGFVVGAPRYPRPQVITGPEGMTYGYDEEAWVFVPVTAPADLAADGSSVPFSVDVMFLVCRDMCMIGNDSLSLSLPAGGSGGGAAATASHATTMAAMRPWLDRLPRPLADLPGATMAVDLDRAVLTLRIPASAAPDLRPMILPAPGPGVAFEDAAVRRDGETWEIRVPLELRPNNTLGQPYRIGGLVGFGETPDGPSWMFDQTFPVPATGG